MNVSISRSLDSLQDSKIVTLDDALVRFCEQSAVSDYVDNRSRPNVNEIDLS
jgi:hypothetical protein